MNNNINTAMKAVRFCMKNGTVGGWLAGDAEAMARRAMKLAHVRGVDVLDVIAEFPIWRGIEDCAENGPNLIRRFREGGAR